MSLLLLVIASALFYAIFRQLDGQAPARLMPVSVVALASMLTYAITAAALWIHCSPWSFLITAVAVTIGSIGYQGDGLRELGETMGRFRFPIYILSVATLSAHTFIFIPVTIFLTSPGEIGLHLDYLLSVSARDAMLVVYIAAVVYAFAISPRMKTVLALIALTALIISIFYSYVLPMGYAQMTGLLFEQLSVPAAARILRSGVDVLVLMAVAFVLPIAMLRYGARPFLIGIVLGNVSLSIAAGVGIDRDHVGTEGGSGSAVAQPLSYSQEHPNALIIFLDRFMGSYVESILDTDPGLARRLKGFTWYPRTVSAGENSIAGVHPMLGGYDYTPLEMNARGKRLADLSVEAFSILPYNFSRKGYRVNVVNPGGLGFTMKGDCTRLDMRDVTCTHVPKSIAVDRARMMGFLLSDLSNSSYADLLVLLSSMRSAPYILKDVLREKGPWRPFMDHSAGTTFRVWAELMAWPELSVTDSERSNLNIVSNILPHEPYYLNESCLPQAESFRVSAEEVTRRGHRSLFSLQHLIAARCSLLAVADYLDFLKARKVYDNTKIVIVSDHGIVGKVYDQSIRAVTGGTTHRQYVRTRSVLLVKNLGASGDLKVSEDFMPNAEVPRIVCEEIGGCVNPYLGNKTVAAHGRDDPFHISIVPWQFNLQKTHSFVIDEQWTLIGKDPFDVRNWQLE